MFVCSTHDMTTILVHYNKLFHSPWESRIRVKKGWNANPKNSMQKWEKNIRLRIFPLFVLSWITSRYHHLIYLSHHTHIWIRLPSTIGCVRNLLLSVTNQKYWIILPHNNEYIRYYHSSGTQYKPYCSIFMQMMPIYSFRYYFRCI